MASRKLISLAALVGIGLSACGSDSSGPAAGLSLEFHVAVSDAVDFNPLAAPSPGDTMEVLAVRPGDVEAEPLLSTFDLAAHGGSLRNLPIDTGYRLIVRGFRPLGNGQSSLIFYGGTSYFDIESGVTKNMAVQIGPPDCTMLNSQSPQKAYEVGNAREDMVFRRMGSASVVLPNGSVLITGGATVTPTGSLGQPRGELELYDTRYGQFRYLGPDHPMVQARVGHTATTLADGRVLIFGGVTLADGHAAMASAVEIVDPNAGVDMVRQVNVAVPAELLRSEHKAMLLPDNSVLFVGGLDADRTPMASVLRFFPDPANPIGGRFVQQADMRDARVYHALSRLSRANAPLLVSGGLGADGQPLDGIEVLTLDPNQPSCAHEEHATAERGCWVSPTGAVLGTARFGHQAIPLPSPAQGVLFVGGYANKARTQMATQLEIMGTAANPFGMQGADPASGELPVGELASGRGDFTATALLDGRILVAGGRQGTEPIKDTTLLVPCHPETGAQCTHAYEEHELEATCGMSQKRFGQEATMLQNGTVLLFGGTGYIKPDTLGELGRAEVFFPRANSACDVIEGNCPASLVSQ